MPNFSFLASPSVVHLFRQVRGAILYVRAAILYVRAAILGFHKINGFLSLQLELSLELWLRLRLTKKKKNTLHV